jgi:subtilisin family serine protease
MKNFLFILLFFTSALSAQVQYSNNECYVRLKKEVIEKNHNGNIKETLDFISLPYSVTIKESFKNSKSEALRRTFRLKCNQTGELDNLIRQLNLNTLVEYAEHIYFAQKYVTPNDLLPNTVGSNGQWYIYKVKGPQSWDIQTGDSTIKVAVCDDAFDINHPDMQGSFLPGIDLAENDSDVTPPTAEFDHGTFIAGLINAQTNNNIGIASLAYGVKIIPIKIANDFNPDQASYGLEGINEAVNQGADVINASWGFDVLSQTLITIVENAINAGVPIIAAAGNSGDATVNYPAGCQGVISVAATTNTDTRSSFSTYGSSIDLCAPGSSIYSLKPDGLYTVKSGTSFSAPLVTAAAALMLSKQPNLSNEELTSCLKSGCDNIDIFNNSIQGLLGAGRLNVQQSLNCLQQFNSTYEAEVLSILSPTQSSCLTNFVPVLRIRNNGSQTLTSFQLTYQLDANFPSQYNWSGNLLQGQVALISLPILNAPVGNHSLKITLVGNTLNGNQLDAYSGNNIKIKYFQVISSIGQTLPFAETFENNSFITNNWSIENPSSDFTWDISNVEGNSPGDKAARLPYFIDFEIGARDYLTSPTFNFSGFNQITMEFDVAYKQKVIGIYDSLIINISTNCGESWIRILELPNDTADFGGLQTTTVGGDYFVPTLSSEWCGGQFSSCKTLDLTAFAGFTNVRIQFEGYNGNGNNIYLDNINITGVQSNAAPVANFSAEGNQEICINRQVTFNNTSLNIPTTYQWEFDGGNPSTSTALNPIVTYDSTGEFRVRLIAINAFGRDTLTIDSFITVHPLPTIVASTQPDSICRGSSATLSATGAEQYQWSGAGLQINNGSSVIASPFNSSNYTVTGISAEGCISSGTTFLTVLLPPVSPTITLEGNEMVSTPANNYVWYLNGVELLNSDTISWMPTANGNYNVRIYDQFGCTSISGIFTINFVGIESENGLNFSIFPNPANDFVMIKTNGKPNSMIIKSITGQIIKETTNSNLIDLKGIASGTYFLTLLIDGKPQTKRLVISN